MTDAAPEVLVRVQNGIGHLTLNRPDALHALTTNMCQIIIAALQDWRENDAIEMVLLDHTGARGFCAGGDIRMLATSVQTDGVEARAFFYIEYQLDHLIKTYAKPVISVMDGTVMGGGVGIALPASIRIATERTTFAMPETGIGLFPDVGGGWYLPRLPGAAGYWMGLTGARLKAADCMELGLTTHYIATAQLEAFKADLVASTGPNRLAEALSAYSSDPGPAPIAAQQAAIDTHFSAPTLEAVMDSLAADDSDWARQQRALLLTKSPQALKVALRQLQTGAKATDFAQVLAMEYRISARVVSRPDFSEGVRAVIIDKDNAPLWAPARLQDVDTALLDGIFAPLPADREWRPL